MKSAKLSFVFRRKRRLSRCHSNAADHERVARVLTLFRTRSEPVILSELDEKKFGRLKWKMVRAFCQEDSESTESTESTEDDDEVSSFGEQNSLESEHSKTVSMDDAILPVEQRPTKKSSGLALSRDFVSRINPSTFRSMFHQITPNRYKCRVGCNGMSCKYEKETDWPAPHNAITGIYSTWITEALLAMARPSDSKISKYKLIERMLENNIRLLVNLEKKGEHPFCGHGLNESSGYSYDPQSFLNRGVDVYCCEINDYGALSNPLEVLRIVHRMEESIRDFDHKVAVHCHAGLGRTGFLLACYLVYEARFHLLDPISAETAICRIRQKRPGSIQMKVQAQAVNSFSEFITNGGKLFCSCLQSPNEQYEEDSRSLLQIMHCQNVILYGQTRRSALAHIPLVLFVCVKRICFLCDLKALKGFDDDGQQDLTGLMNIDHLGIRLCSEFAPVEPSINLDCVPKHRYGWLLDEPPQRVQHPVDLHQAFELLTTSEVSCERLIKKLYSFRSMINTNWAVALQILATQCTDIELLCSLFTCWFNELDEGIIRPQALGQIRQFAHGNPKTEIDRFFKDPATNAVVRLVLVFYSRLINTFAELEKYSESQNCLLLAKVTSHVRVLLTLKTTDEERDTDRPQTCMNLINPSQGFSLDSNTDQVLQHCIQKWMINF